MAQELKDLQRRCCDCGQPFTLKKLEIAYYIEKNFHIPRRCRPCRAAKRAKAEGNEQQDAPADGVRSDQHDRQG